MTAVRMPDLFHIRPATVEDSDAIGRIHVDAWRETYRDLVPDEILDNLSAERRAAQWRAGLSRTHRSNAVFVAEHEADGIVGFGAVGRARDLSLGCDGEIYALYVLQSAQGLGIGRALMRILATALLDEGSKSMCLWVLTSNANATAFYRYLGGMMAGQRSEEADGWVCHESAYVWRDLKATVRRLAQRR